MPEATYWPIYAQIVTTVVAVASLFVGPLVTFKITSRQIRANVVSSNRQKWIDGLRDDVAELLSQVYDVELLNIRIEKGGEDEDYERRRLTLQRARMLDHRIQLRLNPKEADHEELLSLIDDLLRKNPAHRDELPPAITRATKSILKREWERVKMGD